METLNFEISEMEIPIDSYSSFEYKFVYTLGKNGHIFLRK